MSKDVLKSELGKSARTSRMNAKDKNIDILLVEAPAVDPKDLRIDDVIYGIKMVPIFDDEHPDENYPRKAIGVIDIRVGVIDGQAKKDMIVVNGTVDLPRNPNTLVELKNLFVANKDEAREIAKALVEAELDLAEEDARRANFQRDWLKRMIEEDRF